MKASLKFREDSQQKPLLRAKIPIKILGFPFQSGVIAGESKELSLQLSTFFDSGPSFKLSYRPNDVSNPFSFVVKTGVGPFGSPNLSSSVMTMSAQFNLVGKGNKSASPSFFLHFKPNFGDFSIKKSQSSSNFLKNAVQLQSKLNVDDDSIEIVEKHSEHMSMNTNKLESNVVGMINGLCSGAKVSATTCFPVRNTAVVRFRWGFNFPSANEENLGKKQTAEILIKKIPFLVMDKISIEHVEHADAKELISKECKDLNFQGKADVIDMCLLVKRQLEFSHAENMLLRKAVEDLRFECCGRKSESPAKNMYSADKKLSDISGVVRKGNEGDLNDELK